MSDQTIIENCSPTLAGLKTGNLFSVEYEDRKRVEEDIRRLNRLLGDKGIRVIPVSFGRKRALIYFYRPSKLRKDMGDRDAVQILRKCGYTDSDPDTCVVRLISRLKEWRTFPHEIGLFLGYPPEDVRGFMEHKDTGCKCTGFWRVYGDREEAEKNFSRYRKCTRIYSEQWRRGRTLDQLAVKLP